MIEHFAKCYAWEKTNIILELLTIFVVKHGIECIMLWVCLFFSRNRKLANYYKTLLKKDKDPLQTEQQN